LEGALFTSRGCPYSCEFCQTPRFYGKPYTIPLESIERVLQIYKKNNINIINIFDENFGTFPKHTEATIKLLKYYDMRWMPLCRVDLLLKNFEKWKEHGLLGAHLGVESLSQKALIGADKKLDSLKSIQLLRLMNRHNMIVQAFYMIGFKEDTLDSIQRDILKLKEMDIDLIQVQVVTPYPNTPMYQEIKEKYGIIDEDFSKYNSRNLVWKHPTIKINEMKELQKWATSELSQTWLSLRAMIKHLLYYHTDKMTTKGMRELIRQYVASQHLYHQYEHQINGAKQWLKMGWPAYEESFK